MHALEHDTQIDEKSSSKNRSLSSNIRIYLAAALLLSQTTTVQSDGIGATQKLTTQPIATTMTNEATEANEANEAEGTYEAIFKDGVRKTLHTLNAIEQIPA